MIPLPWSDKAYAAGAIKVPYNIDGGYNPGGVIDVLRNRGREVHEINFGSTKVNNPDLYANIATEMWFEFPNQRGRYTERPGITGTAYRPGGTGTTRRDVR